MLKLFKKLKPYALWVTLAIAFILGQSLLELWLPDIMSKVIGLIGVSDAQSRMLTYGLQAGGVALGAFACAVGVAFLSARIAAAFGRDLRRDVFNKIESFSLAEFDKFSTSSLITRCTNDITQITNFITMMIRMMISAPIMMVGGVVMTVQKSSSLSFVLAVAIPLMLVLILTVVIFALPLFKSIQKKVDRLTQVTREGLTGVRVIRAFNNDGVQLKRFDGSNKDLTQTSVRVNRILAVMLPSVNVIFSFTAVAIYWVGMLNADSVRYVADMTAVMQYAFRAMMSFMMMAMVFIMMPRASVSAGRINEVLETPPTVNNTPSPVAIGAPRGEIEFKNVTFRFGAGGADGNNDAAVDRVSFRASPGKTTAIIGGTGSGKSTVLNLITRFYDPEAGEILIDGVNIKDLDIGDLRSRLGLVPQKALLFTGTIEENIRYGKENATGGEVRRAAAIAQASGFIEAMSGQYASEVNQGGANFSGGQKQRLCIARAIIRDPEIYLFDDSFSALDYKTDAALRAALNKETADSTRIIVAQRISTIMDADNIIVMAQGQVVGAGRHKELLAGCPEYQEIVRSQFKEEEIA